MKRFVSNLLYAAVAASLCLVVGYSEIDVALAENGVNYVDSSESASAPFEVVDGIQSELDITSSAQGANSAYYAGVEEMETYFENLARFSPVNTDGSCAYVSLIQYLSYYDTFWNDNIIPEEYDANHKNCITWGMVEAYSPGVITTDITYAEYNGGSASYVPSVYRNYIETYADKDYQLYLMKVKNDADGWFDYSYCSMRAAEWWPLIYELLPNMGLRYKYYDRRSYNQDVGPNDNVEVPEFTAAILRELDLGNPVLLALGPNENNDKAAHHAVVAYGYDEEGIYANFGWGYEYTKTYIDNEYYMYAALVLDFSQVEHVHSNNYIVNGVAYCGCRHSTEGHNLIIDFTNLGGGYHLETCLCGETQTVAHDYTDGYVNQGERLHNAYCVCGAMTTDGHIFGYDYQNTGDDTTHLTECACGAQREEEHNFVNDYDPIRMTEQTHMQRCVCGGYAERPHVFAFFEHTETEHVALCDCDYVKVEEHTYVLVDNADDSVCKTYRCVCGKETTDEHVADSYLDQGMTSHTAICDCGYTYNEPHELVYAYVNSTHHSCTCQECGHTHNSVHAFQVGGLNKCIGCNKVITNPGGPGQIIHGIAGAQYVTANGSYILPNGCIMLVTEDIEAYFNGTLVFYDKDNPPLVA